MNSLASDTIARCHPDLTWSVEKSCIVLFRRETNECIELRDHESALWDFLSRSIPRRRIIAMISSLQSSKPQSAEEWVNAKTAEWVRAGLLIQGDHRG